MTQYIGQQWLANTTSATSNTALWYPTLIASYGSPALPSVADKQGDYAFDRDAKLTPLEWLARQVDDVCRLAAFA